MTATTIEISSDRRQGVGAASDTSMLTTVPLVTVTAGRRGQRYGLLAGWVCLIASAILVYRLDLPFATVVFFVAAYLVRVTQLRRRDRRPSPRATALGAR